MSSEYLWIAVVCAVVSTATARAAVLQDEPKAGWPGVYPEMNGYQRTFTKPTLDADKKKNIYRQTAKYEWTGGAIKLLEVTLARDPAFANKYAAETLKKGPQPPMQVTIDKRTAWLWKIDKLDAKEVWPLTARLVIPLAADRVVILDAKGAGPWEEITELARRFDLKQIASALDQPPGGTGK